MSEKEKRRDSKGRILKTGESQRKDSLYQYRYTDEYGKRHTVYANSLTKLREKEDDIAKLKYKSVDYFRGKITLKQFVRRYLNLKTGIRDSTRSLYESMFNKISREDFSSRSIISIKMSDAKNWLENVYNKGETYSNVANMLSLLRPALRMAYEEDVIPKNPFDFRIKDIIQCDHIKRTALSECEQEKWMTFIQRDPVFFKYYDEFVVLLGTGMRVSEYCGLTRGDLDFKRRLININHQLLRRRKGGLYIERPKSDSGFRYIAMSPEVENSLKNLVDRSELYRNKYELGGYRNFIALNRYGVPKCGIDIARTVKRATEKYDKLYPDEPLPLITPHVFRHTFCTNMINQGMQVKTLQYILGHADVATTLQIYAHITKEKAKDEMLRITDMTEDMALKESRYYIG